MSASAGLGLALHLPVDFQVLACADPQVADVPLEALLDPGSRDWLEAVQATFHSAGALLCALHSEQVAGELVTAALVITAPSVGGGTPLAVGTLVRLARERTSTAGQVSRLLLPAGPAVGVVDLVLVERGSAAASAGRAELVGLVEVQLPVPTASRLLHLSLWTAHVQHLPGYAAVLADVAARLRITAEPS